MLIVETIAKIRRLFREHRNSREISRELRLSRKVVRKALRSDKTAFAYKRQHQPRPQLDGNIARLVALLAEELAKPKRERLSLTRLFEGLRAEGYTGSYDAVQLGNFLTDSRNAVLIGGTGSGKTHLSLAIGANCVREREARVRFFNTVDLVNQLEAEARAGKAGRLASQLARMDLVILDELGYLPFPLAGGQMLFHLVSRLYERSSVSVTTNLPFGECPSVFEDVKKSRS